MFVNSLHSR